MSAEQNKETVRRFLAQGLMTQSNAFFDELLAPNYVNHMMPGGREGFKQFAPTLQKTYPNLKMHGDIEYLIADGDRVAARFTFIVTNGGKEAKASELAEFRLANGKIVEDWPPCDTAALLQQVGVTLPSAPSAM